MLAIDWVAGATRMSQCPACHAGGSKRHLLYTTSPSADGAARRIALLQCDSCGARYADPIVSVDYHDVDQDGMRYYVEQGAGIDVMLEPFAMLDRRPVKRYLEIGCSFGFAMEYARRALGWEVLGFDPGFVAAAGRRMLGLPIEPRLLDKGAVPEGGFDVVFCSEVIEHIPEPDGFVDILRHALSDGGVLLMTTPDGDAVTPDQPSALLVPVLSPSQHVILYNAAAIDALLRRHGFVDVRVRQNATQLQIVAARTPLGASAAYFTRERYRDFLRAELAAHRDDRELTAGFGYRLLCEDVNGGSFAAAHETYRQLRDTYRDAYGYDIEATDTVPIPPPEQMLLKQYGERLPFNLCGVWYCRGIIAFLGDRDLAAAANYFAATIRVGGVLRASLNAIGTDDISVANFCRESEIARLGALAQSDPGESLKAIGVLWQTARQLSTTDANAHYARAARQLFVDLVNLGHFALAEELIVGVDPVIFETLPPDAALAYGFYLLNGKKDAQAAGKMLSSTRDALLAERLAKPGDARFADLVQRVELALLAALAAHGTADAIAAMREVAANRGELDADVFVAHRVRAVRQLFADLANRGNYSLAEALITDNGPPVARPIEAEAEAVAAAVTWGIFLLNHRRDAHAAFEILAETRNVALGEHAANPGDAGAASMLPELELALVTASAFIGRAEALDAIAEVARNRCELADDAFAAHLLRVRARAAELFVDLGYQP
jgi:SAM-dependent methyltransferase